MMTRVLLTTTLLASCDAGSTNQPQAEIPQDTLEDQQASVMATIERMTSSFNRGDLDGVMSTYETDAVVVFESGLETTGSDAIRAGFEQALAVKPSFAFSDHEVYVAEGMALHHTPWTMTGTLPDGGTVKQRGLSVAVLRQQEDRQWLMVVDNPYGLDAPGADPGEEMDAEVLEAVEGMTAAFERGDVDAVMQAYVPGAAVMFGPGAPVTGEEEIRAGFEQAMQARPHFEYAWHEVHVSGDVAVHTAPWTMTATGPDGGAIEQRGLSVAVLRRQEDGRWRMVIDNPHGQRLVDMVGYPE